MVNEKTYTTSEVAKRINISPVTVRKYAQLLEEKGYVYTRDHKGWRQFTNQDLGALEHISTLRHNNHFSVEESINQISSLYRDKFSVLPTDTALQEETSLEDFMKTQVEFNKKVLDRLDQQEKRQAERDQNLTIAMREILDNKRQIASAKQKRWWKFWK